MIVKIVLVFIFILFDIFIPMSLAVTTTVLLTWLNHGWRTWMLVCLVGVLESLLAIQPIGLMSLYLLLISGLIYLLRQQFGPDRWWMAVLVGVVAQGGHSLLWSHISYGSLFSQALVLVIGFMLIRLLSHREGVYLKS